jgi:hypothetical protein
MASNITRAAAQASKIAQRRVHNLVNSKFTTTCQSNVIHQSVRSQTNSLSSASRSINHLQQQQQHHRQLHSARHCQAPSTAATQEILIKPKVTETPQTTTILVDKPIDRSRWVKRPSSVRTKLNSFLVGVALTSIYYYTQIRTDLWSSSAALEQQIAELQPELTSSRALRVQVQQLEQRIAKLEKSKQ